MTENASRGVVLAEDLSQLTEWRAAEFFAGIGLAGLGMARAGIQVVWSNDISPMKESLFRRRFGTEDPSHQFVLGDLGELEPHQLPTNVDLAWASFPCTDLSVAGGRAGIHKGAASSSFWHFVRYLSSMGAARPRVVAIENVNGFATSHDGQDFRSAVKALNGLGYSVDAISIDARHFVPQSRPRLFMVAVLGVHELSAAEPSLLRPHWIETALRGEGLRTHRFSLPDLPSALNDGLATFLEELPDDDTRWWEADRVESFVRSLSDFQHQRYEKLRLKGGTTWRTAYRRMRAGTPRWEVRADGVAGCLRTSRGGSSKQAVLQFRGGKLRVRWMTPHEYAALMGDRAFPLDGVKEHHAYSGFGDAVCVDVVQWLTEHYLRPALDAGLERTQVEADSAIAS